MNINVFSWLYPSSNRERVVTKFGCNGKMSQSYLSYFFDGVPLENFSSFTG